MTSELLKRVAACAPKEMGAEYRNVHPCRYVRFFGIWTKTPGVVGRHVYLYASDEPLVNSEAIVAIAGQLEKDGWSYWWEYTHEDNPADCCWCMGIGKYEPDELGVPTFREYHLIQPQPILATVAVNAFLAVYEEQT